MKNIAFLGDLMRMRDDSKIRRQEIPDGGKNCPRVRRDVAVEHTSGSGMVDESCCED
jgi:hypothetical protein